RDTRRADELKREIDVLCFLADAERDRRRVADRLHARKVRRRVRDRLLIFRPAKEDAAAAPKCWPASAGTAGTATTDRSEHWPDAARRRRHGIIARHQPPDPALAFVVRLTAAGLDQPPIALLILVAHDADARARHRLAVFVEDAAGDRAAARQTE